MFENCVIKTNFYKIKYIMVFFATFAFFATLALNSFHLSYFRASSLGVADQPWRTVKFFVNVCLYFVCSHWLRRDLCEFLCGLRGKSFLCFILYYSISFRFFPAGNKFIFTSVVSVNSSVVSVLNLFSVFISLLNLCIKSFLCIYLVVKSLC